MIIKKFTITNRAYGGTGYTIAVNLGLTEEEGNFIYDSYFNAFPNLRKYYDRLIAKSLERGFILIDEITGRRRSFVKPTNRKEESAIGRKCLNSPVQGERLCPV